MSTPISFSASSISTYVPKVTKILDPVKSGGLAVAELPDSDGEDISTGLVYSAAGLTVNGAVPTGKAVYLKDKEGNFFTLDTEDVRLVASGTNLNLYVYTPEDEEGTRLSADKYVFNLNGVLQSDEPENVSAQAMSKVEFDARRDLNGDGSIGAFMFKTAATDDVDGQLDAEGSLYRVNIGHALEDNAPVGGRSFYVVGAEVAKAKTLNISSSTLLTSDGLVWAPPELDDGAEYKSLRAFATSSKEAGKIVTTWAVYATDQDDQITEFKFDKSLKLIDDETRVLTANDLATLEKQYKRDLNNDSFFGVEVTGTLDDKTGLYKGSILGKEFYLVGSKLQSGTAAAPTSLAGALLDGQGDPWALPEDYTIATMIKNPASDVATRGAYSVFAYASDDDTHKTVVRFDFKAQIVDGTDTPTGNFIVELADGEQVTAADLAKAEKSAKRDLNADGVFGVKVDQELDKVGGLYRASALGNDFIIVGKALTSTSSKPLDLSTALLNSEGEAWHLRA